MNKLYSLFLVILMIPGLVIGQSLDGEFKTPSNMTDKQMNDAKEFVHQGVKDRTIKEGCAKVDDCKTPDDGVALEMIIGKTYALFGMMSGGGIVPQLTKVPGKAVEGAPAPAPGEKVKDETQTDYCMMIAMAYETVGGMIQQSLQKKAENSVSKVTDMQLQSLISLKETHKARKTTATMQSTIYGGVTTCYVGMAFTNTIKLDWKYWAKLGGATALTALYLKKRDKHAKAMGKVQEVIDSIPKSGACNPWTNTSCFCSEATSKTSYPSEYQEICVLNKGDFNTPKMATGCGAVVENKLQFDEQCKCKATNTCLKSNITSLYPKLPSVANLMNESNKAFEMVNSGLFDEGKLIEYSNGASAMAAKMKGKLDPKSIPKVDLTPEQKKLADAMAPYVSPAMANVAASSPDGYKGGISESGTGGAAISKLPDSVKSKLAEAIGVDYQQGSGYSNPTSDTPEFSLPGFPGQESQSNATEIVSFAEQAVMKADVSNAPDTPIFDIISNRYRRSGWEKLNRLEK